MSLPFLTAPDPVASGEGALDPLGLSMIGDHLADLLLPGLRVRMSHPRFLTAIAACAQVCEGIEDDIAEDGATPAHIVFEWLLVEGLVRCGTDELIRGTPGRLKAQSAIDSGTPFSATTYLKTPGVFGFHGVYKPLAWKLEVLLRNEFMLGEAGYELLSIWEREQGLAGFRQEDDGTKPGAQLRRNVRWALEESLKRGCTARSKTWTGWQLLARHLAPHGTGAAESRYLHDLLLRSADAGSRPEVLRLLEATRDEDIPEWILAHKVLRPRASQTLRSQIDAVSAFERVAGLLEEGFDLIRRESTVAGSRAVVPPDFQERERFAAIATRLPSAFEGASEALAVAPLGTQQSFADLSKGFADVRTAGDFFEALLERHAAVQAAKPPAGKRDWFERAATGAVFVRVPYRFQDAVPPMEGWGRPYRLQSARSFLRDLSASTRA